MRLSLCLVGLSMSAALLAPLAGAHAEDAAPKQVTLTQKQIDGLLAAQNDIKAIEPKGAQDDNAKPDPTIEAKIDAAVKKDGFADRTEFDAVSYSVGVVLAGLDPSTNDFVGAQASIKKQIAEVEADKKMSANDKKEALAELQDALKSASTEQPLPGNVDVVKKNIDKLNQSIQQAD